MFVKRITNQSIVIGAPAKLNLFLEVLGKRLDGYHNINSLFQAVALFDRLTFERIDKSDIEIASSNPELPVGDSNLIARAWRLLQQRYDKWLFGLRVNLEKNIPLGGGLGGGSADAAATLIAGNLLLDLRLSPSDLKDLGAELGSDIPFFFTRGQAIVSGRGEVLTETSFPTDYWTVLVTPRLAISTALSYAELNLTLTESKNPFRLHACRTAGEFIKQLQLSGNDFEGQHRITYPVLERIRLTLVDRGASLVRMSGSGATMFGLFESAPGFDETDFAAGDDWAVHIVRPVTFPEL